MVPDAGALLLVWAVRPAAHLGTGAGGVQVTDPATALSRRALLVEPAI